MKNSTLIFLLAGFAVFFTAESACARTWDRTVFLGLNLAKGNSDAVVGHFEFEAFKGDVFQFNARSAYGRSGGASTVDNSGAASRYKRSFGPGGGYGALGIKAERDRQAEVDYRVFLNPGAGKRFLDETRSYLDIEIGPSYYAERVSGEYASGIAVRVFQGYGYVFRGGARFRQFAEYLRQERGYLASAEFAVSTELEPGTDLRIAFKAGYDSIPAPGKKKYDAGLAVSAGFSF